MNSQSHQVQCFHDLAHNQWGASWPLRAAPAGALLAPGETRPTRRVLSLVSDFRTACWHGANHRALTSIVLAIIGCAKTALATARSATPDLGAENEGCLADLHELLQVLAGSRPYCAEVLAHALDGLIIQIVKVEAGSDDPALRLRARPAMAT